MIVEGDTNRVGRRQLLLGCTVLQQILYNRILVMALFPGLCNEVFKYPLWKIYLRKEAEWALGTCWPAGWRAEAGWHCTVAAGVRVFHTKYYRASAPPSALSTHTALTPAPADKLSIKTHCQVLAPVLCLISLHAIKKYVTLEPRFSLLRAVCTCISCMEISYISLLVSEALNNTRLSKVTRSQG